MNIRNIIKNDIVNYEKSLLINMNDKMLKTLVFVDNENLDASAPVVAILDIPLLNASEHVVLNESILYGEAFNILNMLGEYTIYCVWGNENVDKLKNMLSDFGYKVNTNTIFLDLKKEAEKVFGYEFESLDFAKDILLDSKVVSLEEELIIGENNVNENIMYNLMRVMFIEGYRRDDLEATLSEQLSEKKSLFLSNEEITKSFRKEKSTLTLNKQELEQLERFSEMMIDYHQALESVYRKTTEDRNVASDIRALSEDKAMVSRYKINAHKFAINSIKANLAEDNLEDTTIYFRAMELYALMDDAASFVKYADKNDSLFNFLSELGEPFMTASSRAYGYLLNRNIVSEYSK